VPRRIGQVMCREAPRNHSDLWKDFRIAEIRLLKLLSIG
jgi:hypothetical protein